jgi:hypothetical protein
MAIPTKLPVPSLGGQQVRHRPIVPVLLTGTPTPQLRDGLLDTGAIRITDGIETFTWPAVVGFVSARLHYALLGQAGFLQYFSADFDGETRAVTLTPKPSFPGRRS